MTSTAPGVASNPWCSLAYRHITPVSASITAGLSLCTSLSLVSPLLTKTQSRWIQGPLYCSSMTTS